MAGVFLNTSTTSIRWPQSVVGAQGGGKTIEKKEELLASTSATNRSWARRWCSRHRNT
jgi:hypothetical protein